MKYKDYYKILELKTSKVSIDEIKVAYRAQAKKYHPDLNVGNALAEEKIKDINEAYRVLSEPSSKRKYDRVWNSRNIVKNTQKLSGKNIFDMFLGNVEDQLENNQEKKDNLPVRGENVETAIDVSLSDAFFGREKQIEMKNVEGKPKEFVVKIPEGIKSGDKIKIIGQGKVGKNGGKNGDLFIKINIKNDNRFTLKGTNLYTDLRLSPWEAALGTKINIRTLDGDANVLIPHGVQSGDKITIPNKGYIKSDGQRGDLVANIKIVVPKELELDEKEMFEKLRDMSNFNPRK